MTNQHPFATRSLPLAVLTLLLAFVFLAPGPSLLTPVAVAQSATATLSGTVEDQNGAVVPGATVTVKNPGTGLSRQTTTNDTGYFSIPLLQPGAYTIRAQHEGFKIVQIDVVLNVGDRKVLQIPLQTGDVKEVVNVTGEAPLINESPAVGTVVDRQFVENIPLNGRSFQSLLTLTPGVVTVPGAITGRQGEFSVNGQRTEANYYTVDGVSANTGSNPGNGNAFGASGDLPGLSALGTTQSLVSLDALQEFRIQTSTYSAEFGRTPGGQISFVTRSGTNDWHGSLFDYLRNDVVDAANWFNNANRIAKTKERQNDFGGTFSGPVMLPRIGEGGRQPWYNGRNKTFFFFSYEGLRLSTPQPAFTTSVPDLCLRGTLAQCTGTDVPGAAALQPFLNAFPIPNGPRILNAQGQTTGMAQFIAAYSAPGKLDATSIRIDHSFNNKFTVFGRYSDSPSHTLSRLSANLAFTNPTFSLVKTLTVGATNLITSRLANQLRFNYTWNSGSNQAALDNFGGAVPFTLNSIHDFTGQATSGIDNFAFTLSLSGVAVAQIFNFHNAQRQLNLVDTLSYTISDHSLKLGFDYRRLNTPFALGSVAESATFTTKAQVQQNLVGPNAVIGFQVDSYEPLYNNLSLFVQDDWKASQRLSLSLGLRWDLNPPPSDAKNRPLYTVDQITNLATTVLAPLGTPLWQTTHNNFAPRLGAAYKLRQNSGRETVIRGGFGVFYDLGNTYASTGAAGPGNTSRKVLSGLPYPFSSSQLAIPAPSVAPPYNTTVFGFDPHLRLPCTLEWNASVEQALGNKQALRASYVGAVGRRLLLQRTFFPAASGNPNFIVGSGALTLIKNGATSDYDAMELQFQRRLSRGLQGLISYTWSHSLDEASVNSNSNQLLRASSNFDVRHNFQAAITYDLPGKYDNAFAGALLRHWSLDTRVSARSALPLDVSSGTFVDSTGTQQQLRADLVAGQPTYLNDPAAPGGRRVNFSAFTVPTAAEKAALQFGNAPRNFLRAFPGWQVDLALRREFPIHERLKLQFRAEAFNVFNHPIFGAIQNNLTTGAALFGRATGSLNNQLGGLNALYQVGGPRSFQFALRLIF